jgi:hypothetical protein
MSLYYIATLAQVVMAKGAMRKTSSICAEESQIYCKLILINIRSKCLGTSSVHLEIMINFNGQRD